MYNHTHLHPYLHVFLHYDYSLLSSFIISRLVFKDIEKNEEEKAIQGSRQLRGLESYERLSVD